MGEPSVETENKRREDNARKKGHLQKGTDGWKEEMENWT